MKAVSLVLVTGAGFLIACSDGTPPPAAAEVTRVAHVGASEGTVQELTVDVSGEFSPANFTVRKGQPVRMHFKRGDQPTCADEVVFPDLKIRQKLAANQTTTIEFTPQKEGTMRFACGMDMMKGILVVQ